jgi:myosin-crossreactive antigen
MNMNEYLPEDCRKVVAEQRSIWTSISNVEKGLMDGDIRNAKIACYELLNSSKELEKMKNKKLNRDRLMEVVNQLANKGVLVELVSMKMNEKPVMKEVFK